MKDDKIKLALTSASDRILLLPHCLRRSETCQGKYTKRGMECIACNPECPVNSLSEAAQKMGYKGVCVAPGGSLALNYANEVKPKAIVAVACRKELEEGVAGVRSLKNPGVLSLPIVVIPLTKDGCVDTEVDIKQAVEIIGLGCAVASTKEK